MDVRRGEEREAARLTEAYVSQRVGQAVQLPLPSRAQAVRPVLTAALRQHLAQQQQPQRRALRSHSEGKSLT